MNPDPRPRRSRAAWPRTPTGSSVPAHSHRLPGVIWGVLALVTAQTVALILLFISHQQQVRYVQDLREYRDQQQAVREDESRRDFCRLLDQFPEGGVLERARNYFDCGTHNGYVPDPSTPSPTEGAPR